MSSTDVAVDSELDRLRRELDRLRAENVRLSRLLDLRGQDTAPAPEQLSAALSPPGMVVMSSPVADKLALYADRFRFLVADFDGPTAMLDALAYTKAARAGGVPAALEISQSGRGAHVWVFFAEAVPAAVASSGRYGATRSSTGCRRYGRHTAASPTSWPASTAQATAAEHRHSAPWQARAASTGTGRPAVADAPGNGGATR